MTEAKIHRIHAPLYSSGTFPSMPTRIRLAVNCWERVWWLTLAQPIEQPHQLKAIVKRFEDENVMIKAQMRTYRRICFAVRTIDLDEQSEFELSMQLLAVLNQELATIEKVEDRSALLWPIDIF